MTPADLLAVARPIAVEVGERLLASFDGDGPTVDHKSTETDLVTDLDLWSEAFITERLLAARPNDTVMGEEGASVDGSSEVTWWVDPIDGTVNFVHGMPGFNISIAAVVDGRPVAGVVVSPLHHDVFEAHLGGGAFRNGGAIHCAQPASLARSVIGTGFSYEAPRRRRQADIVAALIADIADIRRMGAAALDLCSVACGRLEGYWEVGLHRWDHSAGELIAREAGARVEGIDGAVPGDEIVVAAPRSIFDDLMALLTANQAWVI